MLSRIALLAPLVLAAQTGLTAWVARGEKPPAFPRFSTFPTTLGDWTKTGDDPIPPDTLQQLGADSTLSSIYAAPKDGWLGSVFVAWFQSQRGGASQPHSPQVCLPAAGWVPTVSDRISMETQSGPVAVNRYIANLGQDKVVVLYWYQTRARVIASEWAAKWWVIADRLEEQRTDTSLVRVVVWNSGRSDESTTAAALTLARQTYPVLTRLFAR
jgi:EpsI family protein